MFKNLLDQVMQKTQEASSSFSSQGSGMLKNPAVTGMLSGVGGGLLAGMLLGNNKARRAGGRVARIGGTAALGALAFNAYRNWQSKSVAQNIARQNPTQATPSPAVSLDFDAMPAASQEEHSRAMLSAIVAAAKADGQFDERERQLIQEQTQNLGDPEAAAWVQQEIYKPLDIDYVAGLATSPELAAEIFLASLMVIDEPNEQEKKYLDLLAEKLKIDQQFRKEIEQQLAAARQ